MVRAGERVSSGPPPRSGLGFGHRREALRCLLIPDMISRPQRLAVDHQIHSISAGSGYPPGADCDVLIIPGPSRDAKCCCRCVMHRFRWGSHCEGQPRPARCLPCGQVGPHKSGALPRRKTRTGAPGDNRRAVVRLKLCGLWIRLKLCGPWPAWSRKPLLPGPRPCYSPRPYTEMCVLLPAENGVSVQSSQRWRKCRPARRAMRSNSAGQAKRTLTG